MRATVIARIFSFILLAAGAGLLVAAAARYHLPYENGRYFDPKMQVVYHVQTAELYSVAGVILSLVGLAIALANFRFWRRQKDPWKSRNGQALGAGATPHKTAGNAARDGQSEMRCGNGSSV